MNSLLHNNFIWTVASKEIGSAIVTEKHAIENLAEVFFKPAKSLLKIYKPINSYLNPIINQMLDDDDSQSSRGG